MLHLLAAHGTDIAHRHRIEDRGDGAHIVLTQQQPQQPGKGVWLPVGLAQNGAELLQRPDQDLPELVILLGRPAVPVGLRPGAEGFQALGQLRLLQKGQQPIDLSGQVLRLPDGLSQPHQGRDTRLPRFIQLRKERFAFLVPFAAQTGRMQRKGPVPFFATDAPGNGIIFQFVADLRLHGRQQRAQVAQHLPLLQTLHGRIQSRQDRCDGGLFEDVIGAA